MHTPSRTQVLMLVLATVGLTSCGLSELESNRERWALKGPSSYQFTFKQVCFCDLAARAARVTVRDGVITEASNVETGAVIDPSSHHLKTIEGLFDEIEEELRQDTRITVSYDPQDGHPVSASFDRLRHGSNADEDSSFTVEDLQPLP